MRYWQNAIVLSLVALPLATPVVSRAQGDAIPPEVNALFEDIADIDKLRILNPLKLKAEQIDKLIDVIKKAQDEYNRKLAAAAVPPIKAIAKDIKDTRSKMLGGASIPTDFDDKVKKIQDKFVEQRNAQEKDTLQGMSAEIGTILTSEQKATAVSLAKKALTKDGKPTAQGSDDKYFNYYVLQVFIQYGRATALLKDIKNAMGSASLLQAQMRVASGSFNRLERRP